MTTVKSEKEAMRPRQHNATKAEVRDARGRKISAAEKKEMARIRRITEEGHWRRSHLKAKTKARNASVEIFIQAKQRLDRATGSWTDADEADWEEIYSAARAVSHQADKLSAIKEVIRIEKAMAEKGFSIPKERTTR